LESTLSLSSAAVPLMLMVDSKLVTSFSALTVKVSLESHKNVLLTISLELDQSSL
jgi:hypothetical protein